MVDVLGLATALDAFNHEPSFAGLSLSSYSYFPAFLEVSDMQEYTEEHPWQTHDQITSKLSRGDLHFC